MMYLAATVFPAPLSPLQTGLRTRHDTTKLTHGNWQNGTTHLMMTHWFSASIIMFLYMLSVRA